MTCAETGDFSLLTPITLQDFIWVSAAKRILRKRDLEEEKEKLQLENEKNTLLHYSILDLKMIALDTNFFIRLNAFKGAKNAKCKPFDIANLPGIKYLEDKEEEDAMEKLSHLTVAERQQEIVNRLMNGKKYKLE